MRTVQTPRMSFAISTVMYHQHAVQHHSFIEVCYNKLTIASKVETPVFRVLSNDCDHMRNNGITFRTKAKNQVPKCLGEKVVAHPRRPIRIWLRTYSESADWKSLTVLHSLMDKSSELYTGIKPRAEYEIWGNCLRHGPNVYGGLEKGLASFLEEPTSTKNTVSFATPTLGSGHRSWWKTARGNVCLRLQWGDFLRAVILTSM